MRTTLNLDGSVLARLRELQQQENKPLGQLASELLAKALAETKRPAEPQLAWAAHSMQAQVDLEDHDEVQRLLDDQL